MGKKDNTRTELERVTITLRKSTLSKLRNFGIGETVTILLQDKIFESRSAYGVTRYV